MFGCWWFEVFLIFRLPPAFGFEPALGFPRGLWPALGIGVEARSRRELRFRRGFEFCIKFIAVSFWLVRSPLRGVWDLALWIALAVGAEVLVQGPPAGNLWRSFIDDRGVDFGCFLWNLFFWVVCLGGGLRIISTAKVWPRGMACAWPMI